MAEALTAPYLVAALVLCAAGLAKLRHPAPALGALRQAGLPGGPGAVRAFAVAEVALGGWAIAAPGRPAAVALCSIFVLFAVLGGALARRAASCGCFGAAQAPATVWQPLLSGAFALALAAAGATARPEHGLGWLLGRPVGSAFALTVGLAAAAYATVLAYTALPAAWTAWERV